MQERGVSYCLFAAWSKLVAQQRFSARLSRRLRFLWYVAYLPTPYAPAGYTRTARASGSLLKNSCQLEAQHTHTKSTCKSTFINQERDELLRKINLTDASQCKFAGHFPAIQSDAPVPP